MSVVRLQILIASFGRRVEGIDPANLPRVDGVEYIVSCQNPDGLDLDISAFDGRDDVRIHFYSDEGLSANRNHLLDLATANYMLLSDDDLKYHADGIIDLIDTFEADPGIDMVTTRAVVPEPHVYPVDWHDLSKPCRFYDPISFEIALRRKAVVSGGVRFSILTGIGAPYLAAGEENFFYRHCIKSGMKGVFRDIVVSEHPGLTTCTHSAASPGVIRTKGAFMPFARGYFGALIRLPLEAWRARRALVPFPKALLYLSQGYLYFLRHRKDL